MKTRMIQSTSSKLFALLLLTTTSIWADTVVSANSAAAQGANDSVNWSQLGADNTTLNASFNVNDANSTQVGVSLAGAGSVSSVVCTATPCSWTGGTGFNAGDTLLWASNTANGGNGPVTVTFAAGVSGIGALVQANAPGAFTAQIQVFNSATSLGTFTVGSTGSAVYVGALDQTGPHITSAVFSLTAANGPVTDFAVDKLNITVSQNTGCTFGLSSTSANYSSAAQQGSVNVITQAGCAWLASSNANWLSISSGASGTGSGAVTFQMTANTSASSRTGTLTVAGNTYTVVQAGTGSASGLLFVPLAPCRIADTRNANGPFGGPILAGSSTRAFAVRSSACGIPANAMAYSVNVTVVPNGTLGYLTAWPYGSSQPTVSTLNSDGRIKANAAIVPAGSDAAGSVNVFVSDATQFILDIDGYFVQTGANAAGLDFYKVTPCRIADTRNANGPLGGPFIAGNSIRSFPVASTCNIPAGASAYSLNFTAVPRHSLSYVSAWPEGQTQPNASVLNAPTGTLVANAAIIPAGTPNGGVSVFASDDTDMIIDVNGYFAPPAANGLSLYAVSPCRALDTRSSSGSFNGTLAVNVQGSACSVNASAQAYVLNGTVVPPGPLTYLTLWPDNQSQPNVSTLNALDGAITSNMAIVPTSNGKIDAFASNATQLILDISAYFAP